MPPRFAYWTILIDSKPTAFRARDQQELLPTVAQLKRTNEHVVLKWFAHGRLWDSPDAQRAAERGPRPPREKRDRDWRPGGQHKDPRARFDKEAQRRKKREARANWSASRPPGGSDGDRRATARPPRADRPWRDKPAGPPRSDRPWKDRPPRPPREPRPASDRERYAGERTTHHRSRPPRKPWQTAAGGPPRGDRKPWPKPGDRPRGDQPARSSKPHRGGERPWRKRKDEPPDES